MIHMADSGCLRGTSYIQYIPTIQASYKEKYLLFVTRRALDNIVLHLMAPYRALNLFLFIERAPNSIFQYVRLTEPLNGTFYTFCFFKLKGHPYRTSLQGTITFSLTERASISTLYSKLRHTDEFYRALHPDLFITETGITELCLESKLT